ncbi:MAG TPA: hypothetical protein VKQ30_03210 [Ktedonobacterales bacterium]|nr:hypothetical protein [Ktedonobacterales bacterium]
MARDLMTITGWVLLVIFAYVLFTQSAGATSIGKVLFSGITSETTALQGR